MLDGADGLCSLREAVIAANTNQSSGSAAGECARGLGQNEILLPAGLYELTLSSALPESRAAAGDLDLRSHTNIVAQDAGLTVIHAAYGNDRVFEVRTDKKVKLSGLTISGGDSLFGGAIYSRGELGLENVTLTGNRASLVGGALYSTRTSELTHVTITGNDAPLGSGIHRARGKLSVINSMIVGDSCSGRIAARAATNLQWQAPGCSAAAFGINADPQLSAVQLGGRDALFEIPRRQPGRQYGLR